MNSFFYFLYTIAGIDMSSPGMPQTFTKAYIGSMGLIMSIVTLVVALLYYVPPRFSNFFARVVNRKTWTITALSTALLNALIIFFNCHSLVERVCKQNPSLNTTAIKTAVYIFSIDTFIFTFIFFFLFSLILRYNNAHTRYLPF